MEIDAVNLRNGAVCGNTDMSIKRPRLLKRGLDADRVTGNAGVSQRLPDPDQSVCEVNLQTMPGTRLAQTTRALARSSLPDPFPLLQCTSARCTSALANLDTKP